MSQVDVRLDLRNPRTRLSVALFAEMNARGWICELRVGQDGDDYRIFVGRHDQETHVRHMGWNHAYLVRATDAELQADIAQAIEDVDAFLAAHKEP